MATNYSKLLSTIFDEKIVAVLIVLLNKSNEFGVRELAREANVSIATTYRIIQKLKLGVVFLVFRFRVVVLEVAIR